MPRCSTDLSQISLILPLITTLIFPPFIFFHFRGSRSTDFFPPTTLHCPFSFTSLCHMDDLLLCPRLSVTLSSFSFPLPLFPYLSFDFFCLSVFVSFFLSVSSQVHCLISFVLFVSLSFRGQFRSPALSQSSSPAVMGL